MKCKPLFKIQKSLKKNLSGYKSYENIIGSLIEMLLEEGSLCILNPKDEEHHLDTLDDKIDLRKRSRDTIDSMMESMKFDKINNNDN